MRTSKEIYEALKADFRQASGIELREGGDMALRLLAAASEIFTLEAQCEYVRRQAFPQTADGEQLDMHAAVRAISRRQATKAAGELRFSLSGAMAAAVTVPAGTECLDGSGRVYVTTAQAEIAAGEISALTQAEAAAEGEAGNAAAGSICRLRMAPAGVAFVSNPEAFSGGSDREDDESLRSRVLASYRKLPNGANVAYYEALVLSHPAVERVLVLPRARGRGTVDIIFSAAYGLPEAGMVESVQELVDSAREICVDARVQAPQARNVELAVRITPEAGYSFDEVAAAVEQALRARFRGDRLGEDVYVARLSALIMGVEGVANCAVDSPGADIAVAAGELPVLVSLSISEGA